MPLDEPKGAVAIAGTWTLVDVEEDDTLFGGLLKRYKDEKDTDTMEEFHNDKLQFIVGQISGLCFVGCLYLIFIDIGDLTTDSSLFDLLGIKLPKGE